MWLSSTHGHQHGIITAMIPLLTIAVGTVVLSVAPTLMAMLGGLVSLVGLALLDRREGDRPGCCPWARNPRPVYGRRAGLCAVWRVAAPLGLRGAVGHSTCRSAGVPFQLPAFLIPRCRR